MFVDRSAEISDIRPRNAGEGCPTNEYSPLPGAWEGYCERQRDVVKATYAKSVRLQFISLLANRENRGFRKMFQTAMALQGGFPGFQ